jgi:hypothetical protein
MTTTIDRILAELGTPEIIDKLAALAGSDLTSLLLEVMRRRADEVTPRRVLARYLQDRFTTLPTVSHVALRRAEEVAEHALPPDHSMVALAPLVPFGVHRALGATDQNRVVSTIRGQEVAADPTNALALEAARRRSEALRTDSRSPVHIGLAAAQRVVRAQHVSGPGRFAHFMLFGIITAGRDEGHRRFETDAIATHVAFHARCLEAARVERITIEISDFANGAFADAIDAARRAVAAMPRVTIVERPERTRARGYYHDMAMLIHASVGGETFEMADGGFVDWTQKLLGNAKERCLISGLGIERLAMLLEHATEGSDPIWHAMRGLTPFGMPESRSSDHYYQRLHARRS